MFHTLQTDAGASTSRDQR